MLFPDSDSSFSRLELNSTLRYPWRAKPLARTLAVVSKSHFQSSMENRKFSRRKISSRFRRDFPPGWRIATGRWRLPRLGRKSVYNYSDNFYRLFSLGMDLHCLLCTEKCRILIVPFSWLYRYCFRCVINGKQFFLPTFIVSILVRMLTKWFLAAFCRSHPKWQTLFAVNQIQS